MTQHTDHAPSTVIPERVFRMSWRRLSSAPLELIAVLIGSTILTVALTFPWAFRLATAARVDSSDGNFSIWNVAWVARTLVVDPLHVLDTNIFYPHTSTLTYSEMNLGAGVLAIPAYWLSGGNPVLAHNSAVLIAFVLCATFSYYLVRYLTGDRLSAVVAAICFAFCPFVFARTTHVQLLMTFGIPLAMLAFHRLVDQPTVGRAVALGASIALQTFFCAYYGVFVALMVPFSLVIVTVTRRRWRDPRHWGMAALALAVAALLIAPMYLPYQRLQGEGGFGRGLEEAGWYSANWSTYLASAAPAHNWLLRRIGKWNDVSFPGFMATALGLGAMVVGWRQGARAREMLVLYGTLAGFAAWASFGPNAGLYVLLHRFVPSFSLMRAPSRFGLIVVFGLAVLSALTVHALLSRQRRRVLVGVIVAAIAAAELVVPLRFPTVPEPDRTHRMLAMLPPAPTVEFPFRRDNVLGLRSHTLYMLESTSHWLPLVNGFSDYVPLDVIERVPILGGFPSEASITLLREMGVRYAIVHLDHYDPSDLSGVMRRLREWNSDLAPIYFEPRSRLYEIVGKSLD